MFDRDGNGRVSLEEMAASLSIFHDGDPTEKMRLMFRVYDKVTARNVRNTTNVKRSPRTDREDAAHVPYLCQGPKMRAGCF